MCTQIYKHIEEPHEVLFFPCEMFKGPRTLQSAKRLYNVFSQQFFTAAPFTWRKVEQRSCAAVDLQNVFNTFSTLLKGESQWASSVLYIHNKQ